MTTAYDFSFRDLDGQPQALAGYRGHPLLLVNVASRCGFTPQYTGLEQLWQEYRERGLVVIGFPCNQFGAQEPGTPRRSASSVRWIIRSASRFRRRSRSTARG